MKDHAARETAYRLVEQKTGRRRDEFTADDLEWVDFLTGAFTYVIETAVEEFTRALSR